MRLGSTLLALTLSALMGSAGWAQSQSDGPAPADHAKAQAKVKTGVKPSAAKKPATKKRSTPAPSARAIRMQQAQAARNANNAFVFPPASADPLGLAPGSNGIPLGVVSGGYGFNGQAFGIVSGGGYVDPQFGTNLGNALRTRDFTGVLPNRGYGRGQTATGGLSGASDNQLIRGFDGDGNGERAASVGDITHPRVDRVHGGNYVAGYGVPVRKGELIYRGNYIPGLGVTGQSTDDVQGGTYRPGYGVVGGGSGLLNNNYGGNGNAGFYGGSSLPNNNYFGNGNAGFYGGSGLPNNNYFGNGNAGFYGGSGLLPSFGATGGINFPGASPNQAK